ncbi:hypothetical protein J6TS2_11140 [Heyndrickxia sporothermodurans]|nr:hypothetical protein J6TS2_11140 [Heyndrickxia sporothermodurans]
MIETIYILMIGITALFFLLIFLLIYIVWKRVQETKMKAKMKQYIKVHKDEWYLYLIEEKNISEKLIPNNMGEQKAIEEILVRYTKNILSHTVITKISNYVEENMEDYYRKKLKSRKWSTRMNVLYKIIDFQMHFLIKDVLEMLNSNKKYSKEEYLQMYKILSHFRYENFIEHILNPKFLIGEFEYKQLLFDMDPNDFGLFVQKYEELPDTLKYIIIDIIGIKNNIEYIQFLESKLADPQLEVRIRTLKSINRIGAITDINLYIPFIQSNYWEERLMVAKLLIHVPLAESKDHLKELLQDSSWWVRSEAAQTLRNHKMGKQVLESIIISSEDRYAVDMAKEVLGKG